MFARRLIVAAASVLCTFAGVLTLASAPASAALQTTYVRQLTGFGELRSGSVAVAEKTGDVFVADSSNGTVQEFDPLGVNIATWTGSNTPAGSFGKNIAITLNDATEEVYVTAEEQSVVDVFETDGTYLSQFDGSGTPAKSFGREGPGGAVVDQASGDVYVPDPADSVVDAFDPAGKYVSQISVKPFNLETGTGYESNEISVAVDDLTGDVLVAERGRLNGEVAAGEARIYEYDSVGRLLATWTGSNTSGEFGDLLSVAVDQATGDVLAATSASAPTPAEDSQAIADAEEFEARPPSAVDVFDATGDYLAPQITGTPEGAFTRTPSVHEPYDVAVNSASGEIYVAEENAVDIYSSVVVPGVISAAPSSVSSEGTAWTINGIVIPDGASINKCQFEYFANEVQTVALSGDTKGAAGYFLEIERLRAYFTYDSTSEEIKSSLESIASMIGNIEVSGPAGGPWRIEFKGKLANTSVPLFEASTGVIVTPTVEYHAPEVISCTPSPVGSSSGETPVSAEVSGLYPDAIYHVSLEAANATGTNTEQSTFFTSTKPLIETEEPSNVSSTTATVNARLNAAGISTSYHVEYGQSLAYGLSTPDVGIGAFESPLPVLAQLKDLQPGTEYFYRFVATNALGTTTSPPRVFKTSPANASGSTLPDGRFYELVTDVQNEDNDVYTTSGSELEFVHTGRPVMEASSDGNGLAYIADPAPGGSGSQGLDFGDQFLASRGPTGDWRSTIVSPVGGGRISGIYQGFSSDLSVGVLGSRGDFPLVSEALTSCTTLYSYDASDGHVQPAFTRSTSPAGECLHETEFNSPWLAGLSADGSQVAFEMRDALTPEAPSKKENDLYDYDSASGQLKLVNVLPEAEGGAPAGAATFGSPNSPVKSHVVSGDGSRMFWTDLNNGDLYVRENVGTPQAKTVLVAEGGEYWTASADGSVVFYTKAGDLYSFDVSSEQSTDLTPSAEVQGVIGASEDGSYVYFAAGAILHEGEGAPMKNARGEEPVQGEGNLYVYHDGITRFISTGAEGDDWQQEGSHESIFGETTSAANRAEVASSGRGLVFQSKHSLTGYDNGSTQEVYVYNVESGGVYCASCSPSGVPPVAGGGQLSQASGNVQLPNWINGEGSEVFFESAEPFYPQETAGKTEVYEWEREGAGSCKQTGGCLYSLSAAAGTLESVFIGASESGDDVFFATRAHLLPQDQGDNAVIYDARVGVRPLAVSECSGTGCQGVPPAPPIFATPSSATFNGVGNFEASASAKSGGVKKKTASQTRAEKLSKALRACRAKSKPKRKGCEAAARKRYGAKSKAKTKKSAKGRK